MNKPVEPWKGTAGLHKEEKGREIHKERTARSLKKGLKKAVKPSKKEMSEAHAHMKKHGG